MLGAQIEGVLHCSGTKLNATGNALSTDGAKIDGGVFLNNGFDSEGAISLLGTEITGNLECDGARLKAKGVALILDNAKVGGNVFIRGGFESEGEIRPLGAKITGHQPRKAGAWPGSPHSKKQNLPTFRPSTRFRRR